MNEPFSAFRLWKASQYGCALRSLNCAKKVLLLFKYWQNSHTKSADGNVCTFSTSSSQLASSLGVPLNRRLRGSHPDPYHLAFHTVAVPGLIPALFFFFFLLCSVLFYSGRETGLNIESHMFGWKGCWANMHIKNSLGSLKPKKGRESFPTCHGNVNRYSPWQQVHTVGIHWVTLLLWVLEPCGS